MGGGTWSTSAYASIKADYATKDTDRVFKNKTVTKDMSPVGITFRESRDSTEHPDSLAVAVMLDVTGSMQDVPDYLIRNKLGTLMTTIIDHGVADAQLLFGAVGDHECDKYPLQVGQFESETTALDKWLTSMVLEGGGGGNSGESYLLAWLFASRYTSIDCFEKRGEKGILFTIGDEPCLSNVSAEAQKKLFGITEATDLTSEQILAEAQRKYHVFHIHVNHGYRSRFPDSALISGWKELLGERFIELDDKDAVSETIATTVALLHGEELATITKDFDSKTAASVTNALSVISGTIVPGRKVTQAVMTL